jgi:hypothetical protein
MQPLSLGVDVVGLHDIEPAERCVDVGYELMLRGST